MSVISQVRDPLPAAIARVLESRLVFGGLLVLIVALCAFANLPWHLDEYDQAKQAFVSYEIENGGDWLYQHTPRGRSASKPPLAGWISLPVYWLSGSWELAWRLPGFVCVLVMLGILLREGRTLMPDGGALLAAAAFSLNLLTPRLATLVRTDMMLTLFIFLCGWLMLRVIREGREWTTGERWAFAASMLGALMTKGPIIYAFLLPGMVAFWFLAPKSHRRLTWCGWWPWFLPLAVFLAWGINGLVTNREFYDDVVVREFFSRFDQRLRTGERSQPLWFYFPHFLHKFLPWSLLVVALPIFSKNVRTALRQRPEVLWLVCWAVGGLLCMTFVPSKRVDRIYPVIPPFALLVVAMIAACQCGVRVRAWAGAAVVSAALFAGCYFAGVVWIGYRENSQRLVEFGEVAQTLAGARQLQVVEGGDEATLLYAGAKTFLQPNDARLGWEDGSLGAVLVPEGKLHEIPNLPPPVLSVPGKREKRYFLFLRGTDH